MPAIDAAEFDNVGVTPIVGGPGEYTIDPNDFAGGGGTGTGGGISGGSGTGATDGSVVGPVGGKKRGRKPGQKNGEGKSTASGLTQKTLAVSANAIESALFSIHLLLSHAISPHLALEKDEAKALGDAVANVAKHYPIMRAADKTMAWYALIICVATIYGPRIMVMRKDKGKKTAPKPTQADAAPQQPVDFMGWATGILPDAA
jgi:hypothetical protein